MPDTHVHTFACDGHGSEERDELRAEIARLRAVLDEIASGQGEQPWRMAKRALEANR